MKRKPARPSKKAKSSRGPNHAKLLRKHYLEPRTAKKKVVDFEDEDAVVKEVAKMIGEKPENLSARRGSAPNGYGDAYEISRGHEEWFVMENEDEFETAARNGVERDLADEPEMFSPDFVRGHINMDKLRSELMSDVTYMRLEDLRDEAERRPLQFMKDNDIDIPEPSEKQVREWADAFDKTSEEIEKFRSQDAEDQWTDLGEEPKVNDSDIEAVAEASAQEQLRHPMEYLRDIYGDEAGKRAIDIAGINYKAAAEEAVRTDGAEHFMATYDGTYDTTPSGFVLWRHN